MESYLISGIFYPITIGKILDQRYRIEHKLGHGGFATVWLAHDIRKKRDVALKIIIHGDAGDDELRMQNEIIRTVQDSSNLLTYEDTFFSLRGYMGDHRVLVFPVRGPSLRHCLKQMSIAARMSAAGQLLKALKCLHSGGIVHRGESTPACCSLVCMLIYSTDLNSGSVMWGIVPLDNCTTATKYKYLGRSQKMGLLPHPEWLEELVKPVVVPKNFLRETVYLGDFGLSIKAGTSVSFKSQSPATYCAPKRWHDVGPSFASDMWSYMCLFAELYLGFPPFSGRR